MAERLRLSPCYEPALAAGEYEIRVKGWDDLKRVDFEAVQAIRVTGRKFSMGPEEVYSVYPPRDSAGQYGDCLPHIVLQKNTAPWEKSAAGAAGETPLPWLALLVFSEDEAVEEKTMTIAQALRDTENGTVYIPPGSALSDEDVERGDDACRVIQIDRELFLSVLPLGEELRLLTHGRQVQLTEKVADPQVRDGWFSCVTANRYPRKAESLSPVQHSAYLVSVEGYEDLLSAKDREGCLPGVSSARMFVMADWKFQVSKDPFDFRSLIEKMKAAALEKEPDGRVEDPELRQILRRGFCPVNHRLRNGGRTVSWYRGPLLPVAEEGESVPPGVYSDQLTGYDPENGMMDISLSAAWQLGRMTALRNMTFAAALLNWRFENLKAAALYRQAGARALAGSGGGEDILDSCMDAIRTLLERQEEDE